MYKLFVHLHPLCVQPREEEIIQTYTQNNPRRGHGGHDLSGWDHPPPCIYDML